jgi:hypothetical protein
VPPEQVLGVEGLIVRVVNNVVKKHEVKPRFNEAFKNDGYPEAFLYKQKVGGWVGGKLTMRAGAGASPLNVGDTLLYSGIRQQCV